MNLYLAIVSKHRVPLKTADPGIEERVRRLVRQTMYDYVDPTESVAYSDSGCSALFLFSLRGESLEDERNGQVFKDYAIANTGYPIASRRELLERGGCSKETVARLNGVFSICVLDKRTDEVRAYNNHMRLEEIYYAQDEDYYYVGTRAMLLSALIAPGASPASRINQAALTGFLHKGYFPCRGTAFSGVTETPMFTELRVTPEGMGTTPIEDLRGSYFTISRSEALYDEMAQDLVNACKIIAPLCNDAIIGLTGGKDSRMMVLAMRAAGIDFNTETGGDPDSPDVIVGKRISEMLGVEHRNYNSVPWIGDYIEHDILARTQRVLFTSDCGVYGYEGCWATFKPFNTNAARFNGLGGEILRGGWAKRLTRFTEREVAGRVKRLYDTESDFFLESVAVPYEQAYLSLFDGFSTVEPECMDWIYVEEHMGKWAAPMMRSWNTSRYYLTPLCDEQLIKKTMTIKTCDKIDDRLIFEIIRRLDDRLTRVPLADARWAFEKNGPLPGDEEGYRLREPVVAKTAKGGFTWLTQTITDMREPMREVIFDKSCEAIFDHLKRDKVEELFSEHNDKYLADDYAYKFAWNIYTAAVMLEGSWAECHSWNGGGFEGNDLARQPVRVVAPGVQPSSRDDRVKIAQLSKEIESLRKRNDQLKRTAAQKQEKIEKLSARVAQRESKIEALSTKVASKDDRIAVLAERAEQRNSRVQQLNTTLAAKNDRIGTLTERLRKRDDKIEKLNTTITAKNDRISKLVEERETTKERVARLRKRLAKSKSLADKRLAKIQDIKGSTTWKAGRIVTAIPRKIRGILPSKRKR